MKNKSYCKLSRIISKDQNTNKQIKSEYIFKNKDTGALNFTFLSYL